MDPILTELARARRVAKDHNEKFARIPLELLADIALRLISGETPQEDEKDLVEVDKDVTVRDAAGEW